MQKTTDSAVELTSKPMQRPSVGFLDQPSRTGSETDEETHMAQPTTQSASMGMARNSTPPNLTSAEVEAMSSPFAKDALDSGERNLMTSGVDMYSTDGEAASSPSGLGAPKKSVAEAYDELWS